MNRTAAAALLLVLPLLSGCFGLNHEDPVWEIDSEDALVVMPFKDPDFAGRWTSPRSHEAAMRTTEILQREAEFGVRPYEEVIGLYQAPEVEKLSPRQVANLCEAEYVLMCDFEELRLKDPLNVNMVQGSARVRCRLFQV